MIGTCEHCGENFTIELFHNGFAESSYAYCDGCGTRAILSGWSKRWPESVKRKVYASRNHSRDGAMEPYLRPCECGGAFIKGKSPRCRKCRKPLSADQAADYLERQAPGTKKGWRWQRSWDGLYCAVINGFQVVDNFGDKA
jgi:DNA-directed RNA polymerase subunit RPC12/RpoP